MQLSLVQVKLYQRNGISRFWVNLISAIIIILVVYYVMPIVLGIDINQPLPLK